MRASTTAFCCQFALLFLLLSFLVLQQHSCWAAAYVPLEVRQRWKENQNSIRQDSVRLIEDSVDATKGIQDNNQELFWAVKYLDRYANQHYADHNERQALLEQSNGSWELRWAVNSDRDQEFYRHPEFRAFAKAFCIIGNDYYGKGIGTLDDGFCFVALGGPSTRDVQRRRVYMNYEDFFISGGQVPSWDLSYYLRGWKRTGNSSESKRQPLAFTVICATEAALVVRGSKTGGMAIFRRISEDMSEAAGFNSREGVV